MQVPSLGQEDPLEKQMANPLQYSCLGNPTDRGAWWATVCGVVEESDVAERLTYAFSFLLIQDHHTDVHSSSLLFFLSLSFLHTHTHRGIPKGTRIEKII